MKNPIGTAFTKQLGRKKLTHTISFKTDEAQAQWLYEMGGNALGRSYQSDGLRAIIAHAMETYHASYPLQRKDGI